LRDLLPGFIHKLLRDRYLAGVADATVHYGQHRADEDAVTGALGQAIAMTPIAYTGPEGSFQVEVRYDKIRGRGPNAPEKVFGTDGIFQIRVSNLDGSVARQKALPFQAKKEWTGTDPKMPSQCNEMLDHFGGGLIIDFTDGSYEACNADTARAADYNRRFLHERRLMKDLGHLLADDFLDCAIGIRDLYFDPDEETFSSARPTARLVPLPSPERLITTMVRRL
jgi:hypothetical protein